MEGHTAHVAAVLLALEVALPRLFLLALHRLLLLPRLLLLLRLLLEFELELQDLIAQQLLLLSLEVAFPRFLLLLRPLRAPALVFRVQFALRQLPCVSSLR